MAKGEIVFGFFAFSVLFAGWLWLQESGEPATLPSWKNWLSENGLSGLKNDFEENGINTLNKLAEIANIQKMDYLTNSQKNKLMSLLPKLKLMVWLDQKGLYTFNTILAEHGYTDIDSLVGMSIDEVMKLAKEVSSYDGHQLLLQELDKLRKEGATVDDDDQENGSASSEGSIIWSAVKFVFWLIFYVSLILFTVLIVIGVGYVVITVLGAVLVIFFFAKGIEKYFGRNADRRSRNRSTWLYRLFTIIFNTPNSTQPTQPRPQRTSGPTVLQPNIFTRLAGLCLDARKCELTWSHDDQQAVGGTTVATIKFKNRFGNLYKLKPSDAFTCSVKHVATSTEVSCVVEPLPFAGHEELRVLFTVRLAGKYSISFKTSSGPITGSPHIRMYLPGMLDSEKTVFLRFNNTIVLIAGIYHSIAIEPKDSFGNVTTIDQSKLNIEIRKNGPNGPLVNPEFFADQNAASKYELFLKVEEVGYYVGCVKYNNQIIGPRWFTLISLTDDDMKKVDKNIVKRSHNLWFEAKLILSSQKDAKKVYCYISPKQLQVREYYKLIPFVYIPKKRIFTTRVCPLTKFIFCGDDKFTIDDGYQPPITLFSKDRQLIAATFYKYVLTNIGGSEKFQDKRQYFYKEICKLSKSSRKEQVIRVRRSNILEDTIKATKGYTFNEWSKKFVIEFKGEEGLDWGGVSREFFCILSNKCFDCSNGLFHRFKDDHQELVLPNQHEVANLPLKYYKFAGCIVGKCLYDSAVANPLLVKARFARSFLAQMIGLKIHYKYLESDDPELYKTKVCYIKDNDVTGLGQMFVEEEYTSTTTEPKIVPLIPNGQNIEVTNDNKMRYLNLLAEYRLCTRIKEETDAFLEGLNSIIPDELLAIFDETELELLMCGTSVFKFDDFKSHTAINGAGASFYKVVSWFWAIVSDFTQEEMARLIQFTTGCSQLPPGGFKDLTPNFQITAAPTHGQLPTAHTCFNQLCLPDYDSCEQFQNCLMLAINEGSEGFGFA